MKKYFWIILILFAGTLLRYYQNTDISLWHDEAFSALLIKYSWTEMLHRIILDVHPPMYYVFLRFWHYAFGDSLLALRSMSVFFGVGTIWAGWLFVKEAFKSERAALWVAALLALNPFQIQYATEARMYTMGAFFVVLSAYFLVKALREQTELFALNKGNMPHLPESLALRRSVALNYLGFTVSTIIIIYTHYYLLFAAAAICFYGFVHLFFHHQGNIRKYFLLAASYLLLAISYLPWLSAFLYQYRQVGAGYWIPPMDKWSVPSTLYTLVVGFGHNAWQESVQPLLILTTIITVFVTIWFLVKTQVMHKWLVLFVTLAPFLGSLLFFLLARLKGSDSSVYLVRYFLFTSAFLCVIFGVWLSEVKYKKFASALLAALLILNIAAQYKHLKDLNLAERKGMNQVAKVLQANVETDDKLYVGTTFEFFNLKYYVSKMEVPLPRPLLFTGGRPVKNMAHFEGTAILTDEDIVLDFNQDVKKGQTVWLVWTNGFGAKKPEMPRSWVMESEDAYAEVRPYVGTNIYISKYSVN